MQVDPHLGFLDSPIGQSFSSGGHAECCIMAPEFQSGGLVCQRCEKRKLRTQAVVRFQGEGTAVALCSGLIDISCM